MKQKKTYVQLYSNWRRLILIPVFIPILIISAVANILIYVFKRCGDFFEWLSAAMTDMDKTPRWIEIMIEWVQENDK